MKFTVNREEMLNALKSIVRVVPSENSIKSMTGFLLTADEDDGMLYMTATNGTTSAVRSIKPMLETGGEVVIGARFLIDMLSRLGGETVLFDETSDRIVDLKSANCTDTIKTLPTAEYPKPKMMMPDKSVKVKGLKQLYLKTVANIAKGEATDTLKGIHINITKNEAAAESCSSTTASRASIPFKTGGSLSFILPKPGFAMLSGAAGDEEISVGKSGNFAVFKKDGFIFQTICVPGEYINIDKVFNTVTPAYYASFEYEDMKKIGEVCDVSSIGSKSYVKMEFKEDGIRVSTENDVGSTECFVDGIRLKGDGEFTFCYPADKLRNIFRSLEGTMVISLSQRGYLLLFTRFDKYMTTSLTDESVKAIDEKTARAKKGKKQKKAA